MILYILSSSYTLFLEDVTKTTAINSVSIQVYTDPRRGRPTNRAISSSLHRKTISAKTRNGIIKASAIGEG
ncbi:hypothetical protein JTE90_023284 [Oedothorax gibbosus]|uniref:Uncharacterized protein n=1 Tax=Oedothorax gibbosus TaxID=931172 RepID=A0AAV6UP97_9ARAC|nr:hypothetical protein JTE90_023284 [Oedothorax gibbosus]